GGAIDGNQVDGHAADAVPALHGEPTGAAGRFAADGVHTQTNQPRADAVTRVDRGARVPIGPRNAVLRLRIGSGQERVVRVDADDDAIAVGQIERSAGIARAQAGEVGILRAAGGDGVRVVDGLDLLRGEERAAGLLVVDVIHRYGPRRAR